MNGWNTVFILAAGMALDGTFLEEDQSGFLHGEVRVEAANTLWECQQVGRFVVVGSKLAIHGMTEVLRALGVSEVVELEAAPNTMGHINPIVAHAQPGDGILTQLYHHPRFWTMAHDKLVGVEPIHAESVLLGHDPEKWEPIFRQQYSSPAMVKRLLNELRGISDLMLRRYKSHIT